VFLCVPAAAQPAAEYPYRPIRFIVPYPPGGPTDVIARVVGQKLTDATGQQVIIDNRGGGASIVGTALAANAAPDGYTMLLGAFGFAITPALHKNLPYDTLRDFLPVSLMAQGLLGLLVHPSVPAKSVKELIALAKAKPGHLNYGSTGGGSSSSLGALLFQSLSGTRMTGISYKGAGPGLVALVSGEVNVAFFSIVPAIPFIKTGKLRILGVSSARRASTLPDVPTIAEAGLPGYELTQWYGVLLPARTPQPVLLRLNSEIVRVVQSPDVRQTFVGMGLEPVSNTPQEFAKYIAVEVAKWSKVLRDAGAKHD